MSRMRRAALAAALFVSAAAAAEPLTKESVEKDLRYFREVWAGKERAYAPEDRARMLAFVDARIASAKPMERWELALVFAEAMAMSGNDHTDGEYPFTPDLFTVLPISLWDFPEGLVVTRAHPEFRRLLGGRVVSIGGVGAKEAAARVGRFIPGIPQRKRYMAPAWLTRLEPLRAAGLADEGAATFELLLADGRRETVRLGAAPTADPAARSMPWRASLVPGKGPNPWPHVLDGLREVPPYAAPPDEMTSRALYGGKVLVVRSTSLSPYTDNAGAVVGKAYDVVDDVVKSGVLPKDVVVDLRFNGGGNFLNIVGFARELAGLVGPDGGIWVVTGRTTNSAAIVFTALLKAEGRGRTRIVGEEASDRLTFWSEGGGLEAPASKLPLRYTDGYHDWANGCTDLTRCYWPVVFHGVAVGSISPDLPVETTFAEYAAGKDPPLDRILAEIAKRDQAAGRRRTASAERSAQAPIADRAAPATNEAGR